MHKVMQTFLDLQVHSTVPKNPEIKQLVAVRKTH